jgi:hypothetical protein
LRHRPARRRPGQPVRGLQGQDQGRELGIQDADGGRSRHAPGHEDAEQTFQHCITPQDIEKGGVGSKNGKMQDGCTVKNMKMSGNTASYTMECTKPQKMTVDADMTFGDGTFTMKQKMAMDQNGQVMNMNSTMTGKYLGPCTAAPKK